MRGGMNPDSEQGRFKDRKFRPWEDYKESTLFKHYNPLGPG